MNRKWNTEAQKWERIPYNELPYWIRYKPKITRKEQYKLFSYYVLERITADDVREWT